MTMHTLEQLQSGSLKGAVSLKISQGLSRFPEAIFELAETLEILDLTGNNLSELPADFGRLKKLRILFCSNNPFTVLPEVLGDCPLLDIVGFKSNRIETIPPRSLNPNIRWLILTDNRIAELPKEIGLCPRMQKLMLAGNRLTKLPEELSHCRNLSLLRISANGLKQLPGWLLGMPRLSWLAFSGNVFSVIPEVRDIPAIPWTELDICETLGEGASGLISKGAMCTSNGNRDVAVKLFKGAVTSDGFPDDEMNAFIAAGSHPGLVQLIGHISGHPGGKKGLVMELIADCFRNLGMPPSLVSCTRDVFAAGTSLSVEQVLKIAGTIASVCEQLHSKGIMHGDLYAHNILSDDDGNALLSDFGAASFFDRMDVKVASALERLEVSAFGYLLDDVLSLYNDADNPPALMQLGNLRDACTVPDTLSRPSFQQVTRELNKLQALVCQPQPGNY